MSSDIFKDRERAFEAVYFAKQDAELIEKMREKKAAEKARAHLAEATGIADEAVLDKILGLGLTVQNVEALSLAPLICVAWANGDLESDERRVALEALEAEGISKDSPSHQLFETWLQNAPDPKLLEAWKEYIGGLFEQLDAMAREEIRKDILERAEAVAKASGGFAGISTISKKERAVLEQIAAAMS